MRRASEITNWRAAQIPDKLLSDPTIPNNPKLLYLVVDFFIPGEKNLKKKSSAYVFQKELAEIMNCTTRSISKWLGILKRKGWAEIENRGFAPNKITLYWIKKRKK